MGVDWKDGDNQVIFNVTGKANPRTALSVLHNRAPYFLGFHANAEPKNFSGAVRNYGAGLRVEPSGTNFVWAVKWNGTQNKEWAHVFNYYFNFVSGANTVGAHLNYDHTSKQWTSKFGVINRQADHTWKFRLHNDGLLRAALQWQLHPSAKATLNTQLNLKDIPAGSINSLPLRFAFDLKY